MLPNFQKGKATQEHMKHLKCFLVSESESQVSSEVMHTVVSVIHKMVYTTICSHIQQRSLYLLRLGTHVWMLSRITRYSDAVVHL